MTGRNGDGSGERQIPVQHVYHHDEAGNPPGHDHHETETLTEKRVTAYWRDNLRLLAGLLVIWFVVSFGCGVLFAEPLNHFTLGGFPLGFWFAQQGSIYVFVVLIFVYCWRMQRLERRHGVDDD